MIFTLLACTGAPSDKPVTDNGTGDSEYTEPERFGPDAEFGLDVGLCAPEFVLPDSTGQDFALSSLRGKVALVDISAVW